LEEPKRRRKKNERERERERKREKKTGLIHGETKMSMKKSHLSMS
jgi:hypothetical protein